jgi:hypothetical protein
MQLANRIGATSWLNVGAAAAALLCALAGAAIRHALPTTHNSRFVIASLSKELTLEPEARQPQGLYTDCSIGKEWVGVNLKVLKLRAFAFTLGRGRILSTSGLTIPCSMPVVGHHCTGTNAAQHQWQFQSDRISPAAVDTPKLSAVLLEPCPLARIHEHL